MADGPEIVTDGEAQHEQLADRAGLEVGYEATGPTRSAAVAELGRRVAAAADVLAGPGIEVRGRRLSVRTEWRGKRDRGCRAGERITLWVTDLTRLEEILSALFGTEPAQVEGPRWALTDPAPAMRAAQHGAVADARERAEGYAGALGMTLGPLLRLSDSGAGRPAAAMAMRARSESDGPDVRDLGLEPEPVRVTARCSTTWSLSPGAPTAG